MNFDTDLTEMSAQVWGNSVPAIRIAPGCGNPADLAEPFGVLDLADINAFIAGFTAQQPAADLDGNGIYDLADISEFVIFFPEGCQNG